MAASSAEKQRYAGTCLDVAQPSAACWRSFIRSLGRALWRRPLASTDIDGLSAQVPAGEVAIAIQTLVLRLMTAPE